VKLYQPVMKSVKGEVGPPVRVRAAKVEPLHRRATDPLSFFPTATHVVADGQEMDVGP
jgi:hypothetical protein